MYVGIVVDIKMPGESIAHFEQFEVRAEVGGVCQIFNFDPEVGRKTN